MSQNTKHRQIRITVSKTYKGGTTRTITGRIVTVLRANRKYSSKYLDSLGIIGFVKNESNRCRLVLKALDGNISIVDVHPNLITNSNIIRY